MDCGTRLILLCCIVPWSSLSVNLNAKERSRNEFLNLMELQTSKKRFYLWLRFYHSGGAELSIFLFQVTFREPDAAMRACVDAAPVIDGRRANCNLASLGVQRSKPSTPKNGILLFLFFSFSVWTVLLSPELGFGWFDVSDLERVPGNLLSYM